MYGVQSTRSLKQSLTAGRLKERVGGTVLLLGTCSLLTDISSEMVTAILPLYLVATLGFTPLQYGIIDGLYQGASALVRLASGFLGDRLSRHKAVASFGYGLSALTKLGLALFSGAWAGLSALILLDRTGKGIRTAPRDAMISMTAPERDLGLAFGIHRAMDTAGAMIGPIVAFALLAVAPNAFSSLFLISFFIAVLGFLVIVLLVREPRRRPVAEEKPDLKAAAQLLHGREFRALTIAGAALGLATASDGFIYLTLREHVDFSNAVFPLLATGTALLYMLLAAPLGRLADRWGRGRVLIGGYMVLLAVYCLLMIPSAGMVTLVLVLALLGTYYAATDGVLMAMGSKYIPEPLRGSGLALLGTATSVSRLFASVLFGVLWTWLGVEAAVALFAAGLVVAMIVAVRGLRIAVRSRTLIFAGLAAVCVAAAIVSAAVAVMNAQDVQKAGERAVQVARPHAHKVLAAKQPFIAFRTLDRQTPANYGRFAIAPLTAEGPGEPILAGPTCERVTYRAGKGLCLARAGATTFPVIELDPKMREVHKFTVAGVPSRARISPDGHWGGVTAFLTGHSYAQPGQFSTAATILDLTDGTIVGDLEKDFKVTIAGKAVTARDRNYWGLTFADDGDTFYATLGSGKKTWLIRGSISAKTAHTIHENVECPSLSPDGTRIGFKKAVGHNPTVWRFSVLDLKTGREVMTAETRPLDDQVEWLDNDHLLYREGETTWIVNADGSGQPRLWLKAGDSPAVVRP